MADFLEQSLRVFSNLFLNISKNYRDSLPVKNKPILVDEPWDGWAVGLRRPLKSPASPEEEMKVLLDEFLNCIEKEMTPKPSTP